MGNSGFELPEAGDYFVTIAEPGEGEEPPVEIRTDLYAIPDDGDRIHIAENAAGNFEIYIDFVPE